MQVIVTLMMLTFVSPAPSINMRTIIEPRIKSSFSKDDPLNNHVNAQKIRLSLIDKNDSSYFESSPSQLEPAIPRYNSVLSQYNGILSPYSAPLNSYEVPLDLFGTALEHNTSAGSSSKVAPPSLNFGLQSYNGLSSEFGDNFQPKRPHSGFSSYSDILNPHQDEHPIKEKDMISKPLYSLGGQREEMGSYWAGHKSHPKFSQNKPEEDPFYQDYLADLNRIDSEKNTMENRYSFGLQDSRKQNADYMSDDYEKNFREGAHANHFSKAFLGQNINTNRAMYPLFKI